MPEFSDDDPFAPQATYYPQSDLYFPAPGGTAGVASDTPPADFHASVVQALLDRNLVLNPVMVDEITRQAWQSKTIKDVYTYDQSPNAEAYRSMPTVVGEMLFDRSKSTDTQLLNLGTSIEAASGIPLSNTDRAALSTLQSNAPTPFDPKYANATTLTFGQQFNGETEDGVDYALPSGTQIFTPFAGTIHVEDHGHMDWGKRVFVQLDNGMTFAIGHMSQFDVVDGQRVNPGEVLGLSGGDPSDPSSGQSTGPHVEVQLIGQDGTFQDPGPLMQKIYNGTPFSELTSELGNGIIGTGVSAQGARDRLTGVDTILDTKYSPIISAYEKYFGQRPSTAIIQQLSTLPDAGAIENAIRAMPSHIPGIDMGQYTDLRETADSVSKAMYGHASTDGMVKEFFDQGLTGQKSIQDWYELHTPNQIDKVLYNTAYAANVPYYRDILNESGADPRDIGAQVAQIASDKTGAATVPNSESVVAANSLPVDNGGGITGITGDTTAPEGGSNDMVSPQ